MEQKRLNPIWWILGAAVVIGGIILVAYAIGAGRSDDQQVSETTKPAESSTTTPTTGGDVATEPVTITFTDEGFSPDSYSVKAGETVTVQNDSSMELQFSSDNHPTHTEQTELNLGVLAPGESATFTPTEAGQWGFHDHLHEQLTGTLTVTE